MIAFLSERASFLLTALALLPPLFSFVIIFCFTRSHPRLSAGLSIGTGGASLACAMALLAIHHHMEAPIQYATTWLISGHVRVPFGFLLDHTSLLMLTLVALISLLVQVYSIGYMAGDPGFSRYYSFLSLFAWAMMSLSLSSSLLQLYVFWELVGLSSYLLIGFWYEKFGATQAGKKAFVMTRLGDVSLFIGLAVLLSRFGNLDILALNSAEVTTRLSPGVITISALLLFGGIIGKSAQFPLLTWLPDAMEGPTPVSALLHSATMVAAGVYLFARLFPFFSHSQTAMTVFMAIGTCSMLMASTMAMVNRDIKQVWAYSTISQLGFMIMGLAAGSLYAGTFHLTTHAAFKALLFLCSGVWIHRFGTNDMFEIAKAGGRKFKTPMITMIIAAGALAGVPPLSGFFSKEAIMTALAGLHNPLWPAAGLLGVFLTAYYAFRLIFVILFPREEDTGKSARSRAEHGSAGSRIMAWPLIILAGITLALGFFGHDFKEFLLGKGQVPGEAGGHFAWIAYGSVAFVLFGVVLAWAEFGRKGSSQQGFVERFPALHVFFLERWYIDRFYRATVRLVIDGTLSRLSLLSESRVINGGIDGFSRGTIGAGRIVSLLQSGILRYNLMVVFAVLVLLLIFVLTG
jgi:NADH-quinone oxidoreductase subunit L